ncbi:hypothetical protein OJ922_11045, partial [Streptococcus anginosus]|nr:hypothetical protein [Streptococcus anginosus]
ANISVMALPATDLHLGARGDQYNVRRAVTPIRKLRDGGVNVCIDTGWDSVQEVAPDAVSIEKVAKFTVADVLTNESFAGYS